MCVCACMRVPCGHPGGNVLQQEVHSLDSGGLALILATFSF